MGLRDAIQVVRLVEQALLLDEYTYMNFKNQPLSVSLSVCLPRRSRSVGV